LSTSSAASAASTASATSSVTTVSVSVVVFTVRVVVSFTASLVGSRLESQIFGVDHDFVLNFLDTAEFSGFVLVDFGGLDDVTFQHVFTVVGLSCSFGSGVGWAGELSHVLFE
jgi:hypothetical protein